VRTDILGPAFISKAQVLARTDRILQRAAARAWKITGSALVDDINRLRTSVPAAFRAEAIAKRLESEQGLIFSLLATTAKWASIWYPEASSKESVRRIRQLVRQSRSGPGAVHRRTWRVAAAVQAALAEQLSERLVYKPLDPEELRTYLQGIPGSEIAIVLMAREAGLPPPVLDRAQLLSRVRARIGGSAA
jgi:hypothetical protein